MTVDSIKERIALFDQFDKTMDALVEELEMFRSVSKTLIKQKTESIKLYGLAFNLAWSLRNSIELCQKYEQEVRNSLLHDRFERNKQLSDLLEEKADELVPYIGRIVDAMCIGIDESERGEVITIKDDERILSDTAYLSELSKDLSKNGYKILEIVCFYLRYLSDTLINTKTVRANMTGNEYRFLFEREFNEFLKTEEWSDLRDTFIDTTISRKFHGVEPTKDELSELLFAEIEKIEAMSEHFGVIEPYINDYAKLSRIILNRQFPNEINTPVLELFHCLGRKRIVELWREQMEQEELCYIPEEGEADVMYSEKFNEAVCKRVLPRIRALLKDKDRMAWVCFYHVLVFYSYIICRDFNVFNRWLTQMAGEEIINATYARKLKMSYWVTAAGKQWTKEGALEETNSKQQETKYRDYIQLCEEIRDIINEAKR